MTFEQIAVAALIVGVPILGYITGERSRRSDEELKRRRDQERHEAIRRDIDEQREFIAEATRLLPDADAALQHLRARYRWEELAQAIGFTLVDLSLIARCYPSAEVELPNWHHRVPGSLERNSTRTAVDAAKHFGVFGGGPLQEQEPTTDTLAKLIDAGYMVTDQPVTDVLRNYFVQLTDRGLRLAELHARFQDRDRILPRFFAHDDVVTTPLRKLMWAVVDSAPR